MNEQVYLDALAEANARRFAKQVAVRRFLAKEKRPELKSWVIR